MRLQHVHLYLLLQDRYSDNNLNEPYWLSQWLDEESLNAPDAEKAKDAMC